MPYGDRTGPNGMGPMTGRGMGFCAGADRPGYMNPGGANAFGAGGRGYRGGGFGRGYRHRNWYYATGLPGWARAQPEAYGASPETEARALKDEVEIMEKELELAKRRLQDLESGSEE